MVLPKNNLESDLAFEHRLGLFWLWFAIQLGAILKAKIAPCWCHVGPKINFLRLKKALKNEHDFQQL